MIIISQVLTLDKKAIKNLLLKIYETKPNFPIQDIETLTTALGGKNQLLFVNENTGELPSTEIAKKILVNSDSISDPNEIIDNLIGDSFVNIITKTKLIDKINDLKYPIESKKEFIDDTKDLGIFSIPIEIMAEKIEYPIEKPEQILNRLKLMDKELLDVNTELISNLIESPIDILETDDRISRDQFVDEIDNIIKDDSKSVREKIKLIINEGKNAYRQKRYENALKIYDLGLTLDAEDTQLKFLKNSVQQKIIDIQKNVEGIKQPELPIENEQIDVEEKVEKKLDELEPEEMFDSSEVIEPEPEIKRSTELKVLKSSPTIDTQIQESLELEVTSKDGAESKLEDDRESSINSTVEIDDKIEELGKRLQEKVSRLKKLSTTSSDLPENACKSCEGKGVCYWCKDTGKCSKCSGTGKDIDGNSCETCKGSGVCHSCNGSGKCHWCNGTGIKNK